MKHLKKFSLTALAFIFFTTFITSCSKNPILTTATSNTTIADDNSASSKDASSTVATIGINKPLLTGVWSVSYYFDKTNKTSKFAGYSLDINATGGITAIKGTNGTNGTWVLNTGLTKFTIAFTSVNLLLEISEDWKVISQTATKLELVHVSGGNGGTDYLTLVK
jgi:hypothetical protein